MFPACATTTWGEAHDFGSGMTAAFVLFMLGAGGLLYAWMAATRWWKPAVVVLALALGVVVTIASRRVATTATCEDLSWGGPSAIETRERRGLPAYDTVTRSEGDGDGRDDRDRRATLTDVLFWAGCVGYALGALTIRGSAR